MEINSIFKLDFFGSLLFGFYLCAFGFIYIYFLFRLKLLNHLTLILTAFSIGAPVLFFFCNELFRFKSIPPDTMVYASIINDFDGFYNEYSFGVKGFSILNYIQYKLCFERPAVFVVFNIFYYQIAILYLHKAFVLYATKSQKLFNRVNFYAVLVSLCTVYPIAFILNTSILRESMALMFMSVFCYLLIKYMTGVKVNLLSLFLVIALIFVIRPLTGVCSIVALFMAHCYKHNLFSIKNFIRLVLIVVIAGYMLKELVSSFYEFNFNTEWLIAYRNTSNSNFGAEGYSSMVWSGPLSYVKNIFLLIFQYLLSPLPILVSSTVTINKLIPLIDTVFIIIVLIIPLLFFYRRFMTKWVVLFLIFLTLPALFETNISGAYRHRMNAVFLLFPLASYLFLKMKVKQAHAEA